MNGADHLNSLLHLLGEMPRDNLARLMSITGFDAPLHLARTDFLLDRLLPFIEDPSAGPDDPELRRLDRDNVAMLAQRLLLGRDAGGLEKLSLLWLANGTPEGLIRHAIDAVQSVCECWPGQPDRYSSSHLDFVEALGRIEKEDSDGPLGQAVRLSHYQGGDPCRPWSYLSGERRHTGFPVLLDGGNPREPSFRSAAWVWPEDREGLLGLVVNTRRRVPRRLGSRRQGSESPPARLQNAVQIWQQLCGYILGTEDSEKPTIPPLPEWFLLAAAQFGIVDLRSAGLAIALDRLARMQERPLPAGIGFTGCLEPGRSLTEARLRPATGIAAKLRAAREAGIFVLFACFDSAREQICAEPGVTLVQLPEVALGDAVCLINTACANLGLTEYRWKWASQQQRSRFHLPSGEASIGSLPLPDAAQEDAETLPVGFVGREMELERLDRLWDEARNQRRRRVLLIGDQRAGKTTLLGHWLRPSERRPRFPVWFSFLRDRQGAQTAADMEEALTEQILARFCILLRPSPPGARRRDDLLRSLQDHVRANVPVVVDGLDEASSGERRQAVARLETLGGNGLLVLGSQQVAELPSFGWARPVSLGAPEHSRRDAAELVRRFSDRFRNQLHLQAEAALLRQTSWQEGLAQQAEDNLWMLTDFLLRVEHDRTGLPQDPRSTILSPNVEEYCRRQLREVVQSCRDSKDATDLQCFLVGQAILEDRCWPAFFQKDRWPLVEVLQLLNLDTNLARWERLLRDHANHLVTCQNQHVRYRSATVRHALKRAHPGNQQVLAERLVRLLQDQGASPFARQYAISSIARHLAGDGELRSDDMAALASRLLFRTSWALERLDSLIEAEQPVNEMLRELAELRPLVKHGREETNAVNALESLQSSLAVWGQAIDQRRVSAAHWWNALTLLHSFHCWEHQQPTTRRTGPNLLFPEDDSGGAGYGIPAAPPLTGPVCELLDGGGGPGTLVCAAEQGFLVLYRYNPTSRSYDIQHPVALGMKEIQTLVALDESSVAVLARDWNGEPRLFQVDTRVSIGVIREMENPTGGIPVDIAPLAPVAPDQPRRLLLAGWVGQDTHVAILANGCDSGIPHAIVPFRAEGLLAFAPTTWAVHHVQSRPDPRYPEGEADQITDEQTKQEKDQFALQRLEGQTIKEVDFKHGKDWSRLWIGKLSQVPGDRLFVPIFHPGGTLGLVYAPDGKIVNRTEWHEPDEGAFPEYLEMRPLVWNDQYGLLITSDCQGIIAIPPGREASPCYLPENIQAQVPGSDGVEDLICGSLRLSDGRSLLVYRFGGVILQPNSSSVVKFGNPTRSRLMQIVVPQEDGSLVFDTSMRFNRFERTPCPFSDLPNHPAVEHGSFDVLPKEWFPELWEPPSPETNSAPTGRLSGSNPRRMESFRTASDGTRYWVGQDRILYAEGDRWIPLVMNNIFYVPNFTWNGLIGDHSYSGSGQLLDLARQDVNRWRLHVAFGYRLNGDTILRIAEMNLDTSNHQWSVLGVPVQINLGRDQITAWKFVGSDRIALGYETGQIEIIAAAPNQEGNRNVLAVGFTLAAPTSMAMVKRPQGMFLAVMAGDVVWFNLAGVPNQVGV